MTPFIPPETLKLWRLEDGSLVMKSEGRKVLLAPPRRALPLSNPDEFIVLSDLDGNEVGILRTLHELEDASQTVLQEALSREYVLHRITRILEVDKEPLTGQTRWRVELESDPNAASEALEAAASDDPALQSTLATSTTTAKSAANGVVETGESSEEETKAPLTTVTKMANLLNLGRDKNVEESRSAHEREFYISGQEDIQTARYPHIFIVDTDRNRYEITNCEELDLDSRRMAERFF